MQCVLMAQTAWLMTDAYFWYTWSLEYAAHRWRCQSKGQQGGVCAKPSPPALSCRHPSTQSAHHYSSQAWLTATSWIMARTDCWMYAVGMYDGMQLAEAGLEVVNWMAFAECQTICKHLMTALLILMNSGIHTLPDLLSNRTSRVEALAKHS